MTLNQIFQSKNIPSVYLHGILKKLLARVCFDASFMCLFRFVAFRVTFTIFAVERNLGASCYAYF